MGVDELLELGLPDRVSNAIQCTATHGAYKVDVAQNNRVYHPTPSICKGATYVQILLRHSSWRQCTHVRCDPTEYPRIIADVVNLILLDALPYGWQPVI